MSKVELLALMRLLSALESWSFSTGQRLPDYLHDDLSKLVGRIEEEILAPTIQPTGQSNAK